jgi:Transcriptional regulator, AbiEi antitoxin, Type IV TA system
VLEMLHLAPREFDIVEAAHIFEGLVTLRPTLMQSLLDACGSIKVKRLFLYLAERAGLPSAEGLARASLGGSCYQSAMTPCFARFGDAVELLRQEHPSMTAPDGAGLAIEPPLFRRAELRIFMNSGSEAR